MNEKRTYEIRLRANDPKPVIVAVADSIVEAKRQAFVVLPGWYHPCAVIEESDESFDNRCHNR